MQPEQTFFNKLGLNGSINDNRYKYYQQYAVAKDPLTGDLVDINGDPILPPLDLPEVLEANIAPRSNTQEVLAGLDGYNNELAIATDTGNLLLMPGTNPGNPRPLVFQPDVNGSYENNILLSPGGKLSSVVNAQAVLIATGVSAVAGDADQFNESFMIVPSILTGADQAAKGPLGYVGNFPTPSFVGSNTLHFGGANEIAVSPVSSATTWTVGIANHAGVFSGRYPKAVCGNVAATITTTNATPTVLICDTSLPGQGIDFTSLPTGSAVTGTLEVIGVSGSNMVRYSRQLTFNNSSLKAATTIGTDFEDAALSAANVAVSFASGVINVTVTGVAATTIKWTAVFNFTAVF